MKRVGLSRRLVKGFVESVERAPEEEKRRAYNELRDRIFKDLPKKPWEATTLLEKLGAPDEDIHRAVDVLLEKGVTPSARSFLTKKFLRGEVRLDRLTQRKKAVEFMKEIIEETEYRRPLIYTGIWGHPLSQIINYYGHHEDVGGMLKELVKEGKIAPHSLLHAASNNHHRRELLSRLASTVAEKEPKESIEELAKVWKEIPKEVSHSIISKAWERWDNLEFKHKSLLMELIHKTEYKPDAKEVKMRLSELITEALKKSEVGKDILYNEWDDIAYRPIYLPAGTLELLKTLNQREEWKKLLDEDVREKLNVLRELLRAKVY